MVTWHVLPSRGFKRTVHEEVRNAFERWFEIVSFRFCPRKAVWRPPYPLRTSPKKNVIWSTKLKFIALVG